MLEIRDRLLVFLFICSYFLNTVVNCYKDALFSTVAEAHSEWTFLVSKLFYALPSSEIPYRFWYIQNLLKINLKKKLKLFS